MKGTGVYFCTCGGMITAKVDAELVGEGIGQLGEVAYVKTMEFLCSVEGQADLEHDLIENGPERVVVAACSPRDHENTFRGVLVRSAINPYLLQMANIREHVAWVTEDANKAVEKAIAYIRGAVKRVSQHQPLHKESLAINPEVLVIGAGPAGLVAAMSLAKAGRQVTLVEKSPVIGGMAVRYEEVFPRLECGSCMMEPILDDLLHGEESSHIELLTLTEVTDVAGYFGNFQVKIRRKPRFVNESICIGCGECLPPCPVKVKNGFNADLSDRGGIYFPFAGALPNVPLMDMDHCLRSKGEGCRLCQSACPVAEAIEFTQQEQHLEKTVGAIVVAIGSRLYDCDALPELGVTQGVDVYTSYAFERLLAQNGPTHGEILTVRQGTPPGSVAIVHCVGSLDPAHRDYCSEVCCQNAFKFNHMIRKQLPDTLIHHFYQELVAPGKEGMALYRKIREHPKSRFTRYGSLGELRVVDHPLGYAVAGGDGGEVVADLVILCPAMVPASDAASLGELLAVDRDQLGFFEERHNRLHGVVSQVKGIYIAGTCQAPMDLQKAMNQGMAVAGYILSELVEGKRLEIEPVTAWVDEARCSGCRVCVPICPFKAIHLNEDKQISVINGLLCMGCGTCVAACPSGVITGNHFTNEAMFAEIAGVLA